MLKNRHLLLLLVFGIFIFSSCSDIYVTDTASVPIKEAKVESWSLSMNNATQQTNRKGYCNIPSNIQGTNTVVISKAGYESKSISWPQKTPFHVILKKTVPFYLKFLYLFDK